MVTITIIGLALTAFTGTGFNLLPQAELRATAVDLGDALVRMRTHALFSGQRVLFEYDLDEQGFRASYPLELDPEDGHVLGPGTTEVLDFTPVRKDMVMEAVLLPGNESREDGVVQVWVDPLGNVPPHHILVMNPEFPEIEVYTVRVDPLTNRYALMEGRFELLELDDADFR